MINIQKSNPFWGAGEKKDFGKIAIEYAAGEDVILDQDLVQYECLVNKAHVVMLFKQGLITENIAKKLLEGLNEIAALDKQGKFKLEIALEDVHSNVEWYLIKKYGLEVGGYLRLGIARNDQIYTDTIMFLKDSIMEIISQLLKIIEGIIKKANGEIKTVMPGYTHLRISQPITFGHWLTAKAYHLLDDVISLMFVLNQIDKCPLGIVEMSGTHLPLDRKLLAKLLGFNKPTENTLYTANQRGENEAKVLSQFSLLALHVRRTVQEIIIFSSTEFGFFEISDEYVTGGTAQPNLRNPDTLEVIRGNCPRIYSKALEVLLIMDIQTSGYNRDTQQTKPGIFEGVKLVREMIPTFGGVLLSLKANQQKMLQVASLNFATAPDVAIQLCVKGKVSFRQAYTVVKTLIKDGHLQKSFAELTPALVEKVAKQVLDKKIVISQADIEAVASAKTCAFSHTSLGGPAPVEVKKQIDDINKQMKGFKQAIKIYQQQKEKAINLLTTHVNKIMGEKNAK